MSLSGHRVFISHRHDYHDDFASLTRRLGGAGFDAVDTSVAVHARFEGKPEWWLRREIGRRIHRADVVLVFGNMGIANSDWCVWELDQAIKHDRNILVVLPTQYYGNVPRRILAADNMGGPVTNADTIIRRLKASLS